MRDDVCPPFTSTTTIFASIARHATTMPDKAAVFRANRRLSYRELAQQVGHITAVLIERGVKPGDRVAVESDNTVDHLIGLVGAMAAGGIAVALPSDHQSYEAICEDATPTLILGNAHDGHVKNPETKYPRLEVGELLAAPTATTASLDRPVRPEEIAMLSTHPARRRECARA